VKQPDCSQCAYHLPSNWLGSKLLSMTGGKQMLVFSEK
jgi:predicted Rdx family selenoprotein